MNQVNIPATNKPVVVIIGGGFGGIEVAKKLRGQPVQVIILDKHNYHTFQPLLYQVATAGLEPDSIAYPVRKIFKKQKNFVFRVAEVLKIVHDINCVQTSIGSIRYDFLVISTGTKTNFFGLKDVQNNAMVLKTLPDALNLRSLILQNFEETLLITNLDDRDSLMSVVIVGGGPTGVELAGALGELKRFVLPRDYPELDIRKMQIHLIERSPRLLPAMSAKASSKSLQFLEKFGVQVWLDTAVENYDGRKVALSNGKMINSQTMIWAAGVKGAIVEGIEDALGESGRRLQINNTFNVVGHDNVYAIGDVAEMQTRAHPNGHPMLASVAIQQGRHMARNIRLMLKNKPALPFVYKDKGSLATIGRNKAVADLPFIKTQGFLAWFLWISIHIVALVGFRNKLVAFVNWGWSYITYDKGIRLIIRRFEKKGGNS
ncbi:MAG: NAD(P)/FAD-dependent oxidoreductase [Bacteroidetes bacterium]|nr:NAD(P)/FAD-dependent oxidoreductase [Bacteroidota bacterium]